MSIGTELLINSKWQLRDIIDLLESKYGAEIIKVNQLSSDCPSSSFITFKIEGFEYTRQMHFYTQNYSPIGLCTLLSLGADNESCTLLKGIGEIIGGIYTENDCEENNYEIIRGMLWEEDGLLFHLRNAIANNEMKSGDDLDGLIKSTAKWNKEHNR